VLVEDALGATAKSKADPDFELIGVELKTVPVSRAGVPLETTFVCTIPILDIGDVEWHESRVLAKLRRVLWVPVLGEREVPVADRRIGAPILWSPSSAEEAELRWDWEELAGRIGRGEIDDLHGGLGHSLQVRPKAANSRSRRPGTDSDGQRVRVLPRGFYLRTHFTARVLRENLVLP
jgi:DNA mismatch repair protein MutH